MTYIFSSMKRFKLNIIENVQICQTVLTYLIFLRNSAEKYSNFIDIIGGEIKAVVKIATEKNEWKATQIWNEESGERKTKQWQNQIRVVSN